jgi:hypothetical protein
MTKTDNDPSFRRWPFPVSEEDRKSPEIAEKIEFLESVYSDGFEAYWLPLAYECGASSQSRRGEIIQTSQKNIWELRLHERSDLLLIAYVHGLRAAGLAVKVWLNGESVDKVLKDMSDSLMIPSGTDYSHKIFEADTYDRYQYWPFPISEIENQSPEKLEKIKFLASITSDGFVAYRSMKISDDYTAKSESRSGFITQRGRKCWEFGLTDKTSGPELTAFVAKFTVAAEAVRAWLNGRPGSDILENICDYLVLLGGASSSYRLYHVEQHWPFPVAEGERQSTKETEMYDFLENADENGFKAYRVLEVDERARYGAKSLLREGYIQKSERGHRWQLKLLDDEQKLMAFVLSGAEK